jgi:hypothetical protein
MSYYYLTQADKIVVSVSPLTGGGSFSSLQTIFQAAQSAGLPLFFRPGTYSSGGTIAINGGAPVLAQATPGTVTFLLTGAGLLLDIENLSGGARFEGIIFNGNNAPLTQTYSFAALIFCRTRIVQHSLRSLPDHELAGYWNIHLRGGHARRGKCVCVHEPVDGHFQRRISSHRDQQ